MVTLNCMRWGICSCSTVYANKTDGEKQKTASEPASVELIEAYIPGAALDEPTALDESKARPERLLGVFCSFALVAPCVVESSFYIRGKSNS